MNKFKDSESKSESICQSGFNFDCKEPDFSKLRAFIMDDVRYNSLMKTFPEQAEELFVATENFAKQRYEGYRKLAEEYIYSIN